MPSLSNSGSQQDLQNSGPQDVQQQANYYEQMQKQQHAMYQAASSGQGSRYLPLPPEQQQEMYGSGHQRQVRQTRIPSFSGAAPFRTSPFAGNPSMAIRELRGIGMPQSVAVGGLSPQRPPQRFAGPPVYPPPHPQLPISAAAPGSTYAKSIASAPFPMDATPYNPMQNQVQAQSTPSLPQAATNASAPGIEELMDENKYLKMRIEFLQEGNDKLQSMLADTRAELSRAQESMAIALSSNPSGANPMGLSLDNPVVAAAAAGAAAAATEALKALASQSGNMIIDDVEDEEPQFDPRDPNSQSHQLGRAIDGVKKKLQSNKSSPTKRSSIEKSLPPIDAHKEEKGGKGGKNDSRAPSRNKKGAGKGRKRHH